MPAAEISACVLDRGRGVTTFTDGERQGGPGGEAASEEPGMNETRRGDPAREAAPDRKHEAGISAAEGLAEAADLSRQIVEIARKSHKLVTDFLKRQADGGDLKIGDPLGIGAAFLDMTAHIAADPSRLVQAQLSLWHDYLTLWQRTAQRFWGGSAEPVIEPAAGDRRFRDPAWSESTLFDFIKQSYLLTARWLQASVRNVAGLDDHTARKIDFYTRQFVDALAPSNFVLTNPEVLRATIESRGENLLRGLENLLDDLERGGGRLKISMTDTAAFRLGENIAATPGQVVYQNELMQLIQYAPTTATVKRRPLLIIPPWINKFYILDLRPENSFVRWAVAQGHTVFMISWVNPDARLARKSFEDYMFEGPLAALDALYEATGERRANVIGYCLGGTLLAATLAYMAAKRDRRIASATYFVTMVDFAEAGELSVFIDEEQLKALDERMQEKGYLEGRDMAMTFNLLRANDLIWSFVVNNYLLGKSPLPFDLLYWNADSTRMPAAMHSFYLHNMYQENLLVRPGGITLGGVPIDLRRIRTPSFLLSTREDHIAPWRSTYAATRLYRGPVKFVLAASGHIAGVINPPGGGKYGHWENDHNPPTAEEWLAGAVERPGSWWPLWERWVSRYGGGEVPARTPGGGKLPPIEPAPGSYVRVRAED
jgi:polyhydroxyalkanoate synthase